MWHIAVTMALGSGAGEACAALLCLPTSGWSLQGAESFRMRLGLSFWVLVCTPLQWLGLPWVDAAAHTFPKRTLKDVVCSGLSPAGWVFGHISPGTDTTGLSPLRSGYEVLLNTPIKVTHLPIGSVFCLFYCKVGAWDGETCRKGRIMSPSLVGA